VLAFVAIAALLTLVVWQSNVHGRTGGDSEFRPAVVGDGVLGGWLWFDATWYVDIADHGYFYTPGQQSSVAFFPAYPLVVRATSTVTGDTPLAAIAVTFACGLAAAVLFWTWLRERLSSRARVLGLALLLVYPYAWFIYGSGYADALFLAATLGAFLLFERGRPGAAGLVGAVAVAARPVGIAVVVGLAVLAWRRRADIAGALSAPLLALGGLVAWCGYLAVRFGDPFAFASVQGARGWDQAPGPRTWFKVEFFEHLTGGDHWFAVRLILQAAATIVVLAFVPAVVRRFGWAYGAYVLLIVGIPLVGTGDFQGMGRYLISAFPVFAVAGERLAGSPVAARVATLASSGALLVVLTSFFARGYYLT
jgi:Gpi18-like mannosyltransferase